MGCKEGMKLRNIIHVNANKQNTIFIDFFLDPAVVDF